MLFSQFISAAISIFITPLTVIAAAFLLEWDLGAALAKKTPASADTQHD